MILSLPWLLVEAGTSLFEIILILTFLNGFFSKKGVPLIKKVTVLLSAFFVIFMVSLLLFVIPNAVTFNFFIVTLAISLLLYKGKLANHFFICILLLAILVVVELITLCILVLCLRYDATVIQSDPILRFIGVVIKNILSLVIIKVICNFRKANIHETGRVYFVFLLIVPVISIIVALILLDLILTYNISNLSVILLAYSGLMYINAIVFGIFEMIMRQMDKEWKYKMMEKQLELQISHYNKLAENREMLSEVIHDFKNHLNCIYNLYRYDNSDELGRYIEKLINVSDMEKIIDTGNPVIDALLNDKLTVAKKLGIDFNTDLNLPSNLRIAPTDICAVLGNSLDNAIEACKRITSNALRREISLSMNYKDTYLVIVVSNTFEKPPLREGKFFRSTKPHPEFHGLGMQSIDRTVRKYEGNMVIKWDQSLFKLEIVMPGV